MSDHTSDLYAALFARLNGDAAIAALIGSGKVFNGVADGAVAPYIDLGDDTAADYASSGAAAPTDAQEHTVTIHVWAEQPVTGGSAKKQCLDIMAAVRASLHTVSLALASGRMPNLRCEFHETFRDPDGISWHGVLRFRAVTQD